MVNKLYVDEEDIMRESKTDRKTLEHRRKCSKWGKKFCVDCFGGADLIYIQNDKKE